jgi:OmpR family response regulator RpaB
MTTASGMTKKILIVDDQVEIRSLLYLSLKQLGYILTFARDGESALKTYRKTKPDILILDIMMDGELSGLDVSKQIRAGSDIQTKIIFLSALSQPADIAAGFAAGGDSYVTKPFSPMSLIRGIQKL